MAPDFNNYLKNLAEKEYEKAKMDWLNDPRNAILTYSGVHLNWIADYVSNPASKWVYKVVPVEEIALSGTNPEWNKILLKDCERSPVKFKQLLVDDSKMRKYFESFYDVKRDRNDPLLLRNSPREGFRYTSLDGMHRFVRALMQDASEVEAFIIENEKDFKPFCEPHVIYDFLRAYRKSDRTQQDTSEMIAALRFLIRNYANVAALLKERFSSDWVDNQEIQDAISEALSVQE